jgi:pimeloyl-ACP methyl ester carboxylesterase
VTALERAPAATAADEQPVFIAAPPGDLLAVVTQPTRPATGLVAVLLRGGGWRPSSGPRRTQVRLARRLAAAGLHCVRFSYHGVAESGGQSEEVFRLDQPFVEDLGAVGRWVAQQGLRPVLVGNCFGARTALSYACRADAPAGVALIVPPVHDFEVARRLDRRPVSALARRATVRRAWAVLRSPARRRALGRTTRALTVVARHRLRPGGRAEPEWLSRGFRRELASLVERRVPVLLVYGEDDNYRRDFELARAGALGEIIANAGPRLEVEVVPGKIHGLTSVATQEATLAAVERWVVASVLRAAGPEHA